MHDFASSNEAEDYGSMPGYGSSFCAGIALVPGLQAERGLRLDPVLKHPLDLLRARKISV